MHNFYLKNLFSTFSFDSTNKDVNIRKIPVSKNMLRQKLNDSMIPTYNYNTFVMEGLQTIICFLFCYWQCKHPFEIWKKRNKNVLQMEYLVNFLHILK